ncbi:MAG: 3-isopropylmalate dehydratase small subunit [Candidatus Omnitrophica bacterium]|nr:3-isopropylmalate dehydratase small subunit [Candidatus Omnitrophota bacterium]MCF7877677.1 3-isopropylmalate dehydratase small subunit [Candidatus Omnitrophota bacterium]MCF7891715.1 3-isopropylmalate dehydratase small subunit [Candidatus Omnitrophota bacterium]MCF7895589.1 3-isopropylmalate dehydratase small subunit [Candidatus Omnitrophota bacterium]MCF7897891.1 3-isopropylmalate dehydratase small subunit [Candidatus Omnitrophota bacterium]
MIIKGKVHKLGNNINTDDIIAAKYLDSQDPEFLGSRCMENIDSQFPKKVKKGDIIVAGENFGCGSSREHAPVAIKGCGISLVIAASFARIFFRNSINIGLPIIELAQVKEIGEGVLIEADLAKGVIKNKTENKTYYTKSFPSFLQKIIEKGGLINWIRDKKQ